MKSVIFLEGDQMIAKTMSATCRIKFRVSDAHLCYEKKHKDTVSKERTSSLFIEPQNTLISTET